MESRLKRLEIDAERAKFNRMKQNSPELDCNRTHSSQREGAARTKETLPGSSTNNQSAGSFKLPAKPQPCEDNDKEDSPAELVRANSWAEEVEAQYSPGVTQGLDDRRQWTSQRRIPSEWQNELDGQVKEAADRAGRERRTRRGNREPQPSRITTGGGASTRMEGESHNCAKFNPQEIHHWFGESTDEQSNSDSDTDSRDWSTIDREGRRRDRRRRAQDRKQRKMSDVAHKARRMVGLGPISDKDIDHQFSITKDYSKAKIWAAKAHLASQYEYNQVELDRLEIVKTKQNSKDEIIYIALRNEMDVRDIYSRKAECMKDDNTVKQYIPPQYFERFSTLNRICKDRRTEDPYLKTQVRFGDKDLIVLTKEKGSEDPYRVADLKSFVGNQELPDFDITIRWRIQEDRPPRRRLGTGPATAASRNRTPSVNNPLVRQHSSNTDLARKKPRTTEKSKECETPTTGQTDMDTTQ